MRTPWGLTYGVAPSIAVAQPARIQDEMFRSLQEVQRRKPWLMHKQPERWAAMVMSDNTRTLYGRSAGQVEERYLANVLGTFRACTEAHLPVTIINDWNLTPQDLAQYKVLILPNTASLDDRQSAAIADFVKNGGGLVASLDTSLFDEFGTPRKNFALAEVMGVDYRGLPDATPIDRNVDVNFALSIGPDYWEKRKNSFDFRMVANTFLDQGTLQRYIGLEPVTFKGPAVRVATRADAKIVGTIQSKTAIPGQDSPAMISHTYGKGKVVYFAAGLDAGYYLYSYPYQRLALERAIRWVAPIEAPVKVVAPMCVYSTTMRQPNGKGERLITHLYNNLNTTAGHAFPNDDVPLREEVIPIRDITVSFRNDYRIRNVRQEPEGINLPIERTPTGMKVAVPRLEIHTMVVAELE